jgi:PKD repeat protein
MFKHMLFRGVKVSILPIFVFIFLLFFIQGDAFSAEMTFNLPPGLNGISLPFEGTGITDAEELCQSISYCESVSYWDAQTQKFVIHKSASSENNFSVTPGYPYFVSVTQNTSVAVSGDIPSYLTFDLIITTTDINTISLPLDRRLYITDAEKLAEDIPYCDTVWYWDANAQGFIGHPKGSEINNFPVYPGYPYFVNITENTTWPEDITPPKINITYPSDGAFLNTTTPTITITFSDEDSGINNKSFNVKINGVDSSSLFTVTKTGATYKVTSDLPVGNNTITASISDNAGNTASATSNFTIGVLRAIPGASPTSGLAPLTVHFTTDGEDPFGTIVAFRWDFDGNGTWDTYDTVARDINYTYNLPGTYNAKLQVTSSTGQTAVATVTITALNNPPVATAKVVPSNGQVPLAVQLMGSGTDKDGTIVLYEWDFEGDGVYDWSSTTTGNTTYTYTIEGTYQAVFRVTDDKGAKTTAVAVTTAVRAGPPGSPTATASANPISGNAPLTVNFTGTATDPNNDPIVRYEWDFDGDGVYDWSSTTTGSTSYIYNKAGTHVASFRVTDSTGLTGIDQILITVSIQTSLSIQNNTVGFLPGSSGMTANASSQYSSSYSPSNAIDGNTGTLWYTASGAASSSWFEVLFNTPQRISGITITWYDSYNYKISRGRIEIYDASGNIIYSQETDLTGSVSQVSLPVVENASRLRLVAINTTSTYYVIIREFEVDSTPMPGSTIEPTGTNINTTISAATQVSIFINDSNGNIVRTLVNNEYRNMGSYSDYWNVRDDNGFMVNDGVHYAILQYILDGKVVTLDLTNSTGGTRYSFPTGSGCDQRNTIGSSFSPYEDNFLPITFRLCKASEVTVFIGPLWSGGSETRIRTIVNRKALPAGSNTVYWDGLDDQGNIAHPPSGDALILGMWRYTLPDNSMYVTGQRPVISSVTSDPNYFNPLSNTCLENGDSINVTYTLSEDVDTVELRVISLSTKNTVRVIKKYNVSAGEKHIFWDGRNNDGNYVEEGDYQLALSATDAEGNQSLLTSVNLIRLAY